jgi:hypothetical protein
VVGCQIFCAVTVDTPWMVGYRYSPQRLMSAVVATPMGRGPVVVFALSGDGLFAGGAEPQHQLVLRLGGPAVNPAGAEVPLCTLPRTEGVSVFRVGPCKDRPLLGAEVAAPVFADGSRFTISRT